MEEFRIIENFENYSVSNLGNVKNNSTGKILKGIINGYGYRVLTLFKNRKSVTQNIYRLVAVAFIPNPNNKRCVDHIDNNKANDNVNNLRWATYSENGINAPCKINSKSGARGITYNASNKKFRSTIVCNRQVYFLGEFKTIDEAKQARKIKGLELFGEFMHMNEK